MEEILAQYRRIMDAIHAGGNIFYDKSRLEAYTRWLRGWHRT